jgi:hypothetical protein
MYILIVICEGETEQEFCKEILAKHLLEFQIYVQATEIGGIRSWPYLLDQVERLLSEGHKPFVTTLIDFYGIYPRHQYPLWGKKDKYNDTTIFIADVCKEMKKNIPENIRDRFIPYIQKYEFEALLFNDINYFEDYFTNIADKKYLIQTLNEYENPEDINNDPNTAPSKRLIRSIEGYGKVIDGINIVKSIGLENIRAKCPGFNEWVTRLEKIGKDKP